MLRKVSAQHIFYNIKIIHIFLINMKKLTSLILFFAICLTVNAQGEFAKFFYNKTMRLDYYHAGGAGVQESFFFDELVEQPYFAGSKVNLIDTCGYGCYQLRLIDKASGELIYQKGYDNLMKEWLTTPEAKLTQRAMPESITFPYPRFAAEAQIWVRDKKNKFQKKFSYDIDPESYFIRKFVPSLQTYEISYMGNAEHCVDVVLIPDGYTEVDKDTFIKDCEIFAESMFSFAPYGDNKMRFNIRAVWSPSPEAGVTIPGENIWRNTSLKASYYTFDSERYQMITDMQNLSEIAAHVPYDYIYVITNSQKYGGGAIYNWYGISAAHIKSRSSSTRKTYAHEFGHLLCGLGDEYVGGSETDMYDLKLEPWEANLTTLKDFGKKWKDLIEAGTPIPTPIPEGYDRNNEYKMSDWKVGVYEGGGYLDKGIYRPVPNCMMNWMHTQDEFCPVCTRAIKSYIDFICK